MDKGFTKLVLIIILVLIFISGCQAGETPVPTTTMNPDAALAAAAETANAYTTATAAALELIPSPTLTLTPTPTSTPAPTEVPPADPAQPEDPSPTPTLTPVPVTGKPCLRAEFVKDVTIPDGAEILKNRAFTKTWKFINTGSCVWTPDFTLTFYDGDLMGGELSVPFINKEIPNGIKVDVSVELTAPKEPGVYRGYWMLRSADGQFFGIGPLGNRSFWVEIRVP